MKRLAGREWKLTGLPLIILFIVPWVFGTCWIVATIATAVWTAVVK